MLELTRKYQFHAARKLTSLPDSHPCSKIHGHTFSVIIKLSGKIDESKGWVIDCLLYTSPSPRDGLLSRMPSSA